MEGSMRGTGNRISDRGGGLNDILMETVIMVNFNQEKLMVRVSTNGTITRSTMVSGMQVSSTATASGRVSSVTRT